MERPHLYVEDRWARHLGNGNSHASANVSSIYSDTIRFLVCGGQTWTIKKKLNVVLPYSISRFGGQKIEGPIVLNPLH